MITIEGAIIGCVISLIGGIVIGLVLAFSAVPEKPEWCVEEENDETTT